jgi:hypothetical protein
MKTYVYFLSYIAQFFLEREMFRTKVVAKYKIFFAQHHIFENRAVNDITWRNSAESGRPQMTI